MIERPASYDGKTTYEGEFGIVISKTCSNVSADDADDFIFGYTCVNDVTASDILNRDATFAQEDLTKAREDAVRTLQDMRLESERSRDSEQQGALQLRQARQELAKTLRDPNATGLDVRFADLDSELDEPSSLPREPARECV